jgi:membrane dipeptidase
VLPDRAEGGPTTFLRHSLRASVVRLAVSLAEASKAFESVCQDDRSVESGFPRPRRSGIPSYVAPAALGSTRRNAFQAPALLPEIAELMARGPVFDAHVDSIGRALDLGHDLGERGPGQLDLVRGRSGGLGAWVVVAWVDPELYLARSFERAAAMLACAHELARRRPDRMRMVGNARELDRARSAGAIAGVAGIEGGHAIEESLAALTWFFARGLRVMTLVWNNHLSWVRSCQPGAGAGVPRGLSRFGREVVRAMNELGVVVDLSHAGERAFFDALATSRRPVIASHSGCRALHDHPRNLSDAQLSALAAHGGMVGIVFHPGFLDAEARTEEARVRGLRVYQEARGASEAQRYLARQTIMRRYARPLSAERLVDHVLHAVEVAGVDHVGLGSDFDGIERAPAGLEDASGYGVLAGLLVRRGMGLPDVEKILGANLRRVFAEVTGPATAAYDAHIQPLDRSRLA